MGQQDQMLQKKAQQQIMQQIRDEEQQAGGAPQAEAPLQQEQHAPVQHRAPLPEDDEMPQEEVELGGRTVEVRLLADVAQEVDQAVQEIEQQELEQQEIDNAVERMVPQADFRIYDQQELAAMGKIRRRYHQVRQHFWRKKQASAREAARDMLRMRQEDNPILEDYNAITGWMDAQLQRNGRQRDKIYQKNARFFDAWARLIKTHDEFNKDFFFALQMFGVATEYAKEPGKYHYDEQVNGYLRCKENLGMLEEELERKIQFNGIPQQADAIVKGLKLAKLPQDMVLHKKMSMDTFTKMLDLYPADDGEEVLRDLQAGHWQYSRMATQEVVDASMFPVKGEQAEVEMVILARKGTQGIPFGGTPLNQRIKRNQNTFVLAPETELNVLKVEKKADGNQGWRVYVETVPTRMGDVN